MAPITDDVSQGLHDLVSKLESRIQLLEDKLHQATGGAPKPSSDGKEIRMILMGPPGAGAYSEFSLFAVLRLLGPPANAPLQARVRRRRRSRRCSPAAIW